MGYRLRYLAFRRERVNGSCGAGEAEGREGVVRAGFWIRFRDYLRREDGLKYTVCLLVQRLVRTLYSSQPRVLADADEGPGAEGVPSSS